MSYRSWRSPKVPQSLEVRRLEAAEGVRDILIMFQEGAVNLLNRVLREESQLDRLLRDHHAATASADSIGIFYSSQPLTLGMTKWPVKALVLVSALTLAGLAASDVQKYSSRMSHYDKGGPWFRFRPIKLEDGSTGELITQPPIASFGFLQDLWPLVPARSSINGSTLVLDFGRIIEWNGHYFTQDVQGLGVRKYEIEESSDGQSWKLRRSDRCFRALCRTSGKLNNLVRVDYRPPWDKMAAIFMHVVPTLTILVGFALIFMNKPVMTRRVFCLTIGYHAVFYLAINGFGYSEEAACNTGTAGCVAVFFGITSSLVMAYMLFWDLYYLGPFNMWIWWGTGWSIYHGTRLFQDDFGMVRMISVIFLGIAPLTLGCWGYYHRLAVIRKAGALVKADQDIYDLLFKTLLDSQYEHLQKLSEVAQQHGHYVPVTSGVPVHDQVRHVMPPPSDGGTGMALLEPEQSNKDKGGNSVMVGSTASSERTHSGRMLSVSLTAFPVTSVCVRSLDLLYNQAIVLSSYIRDKVQEWAEVSQGHFPVAACGEESPMVVPWSEAKEDDALRSRIKWPKLKSPARSIEKALRCYKNDVSRVVDICRQTIVYSSVTDLTESLTIIASDSEVKIRRIVNRMDENYDSSRTSGYRDVKLNVSICNEATEMLGLEQHVCEVQLILKEFFEIKTAEAHVRYVYFRNMRSE